MYACARTENRERDLSKSARACVQVVDPFLSILQKEKKVVFTAAIHRSISSFFGNILNVSLTRGSSNFSHERNTHNARAIKHIERAPLSFFLRERARARERQSLLLRLLLRRKGEREREREIFFRSVEFLFFFFPQEDEEEEEEEEDF